MSLLSELIPVTGSGSGGGLAKTVSEVQTATEGQTVFDLQGMNYRTGYQDVTVAINGVVQERNADTYAETGNSQITTTEGLKAGDRISFSVIRLVEAS